MKQGARDPVDSAVRELFTIDAYLTLSVDELINQ
jgi:hypothetical protein